MSTETMAAAIAADPAKAAKLRQRIRDELADYAVTIAVASELSGMADSRYGDAYREEARIRQFMGVLGLSLAAGAFSHEAALALLDQAGTVPGEDKTQREEGRP